MFWQLSAFSRESEESQCKAVSSSGNCLIADSRPIAPLGGPNTGREPSPVNPRRRLLALGRWIMAVKIDTRKTVRAAFVPRSAANPLPITGSRNARPSGRTNRLIGWLAKQVYRLRRAEKDRFRTGLTLVFVQLLSCYRNPNFPIAFAACSNAPTVYLPRRDRAYCKLLRATPKSGL